MRNWDITLWDKGRRGAGRMTVSLPLCIRQPDGTPIPMFLVIDGQPYSCIHCDVVKSRALYETAEDFQVQVVNSQEEAR